MSGGKLSWEQFNAVNEDRRTAFEDFADSYSNTRILTAKLVLTLIRTTQE